MKSYNDDKIMTYHQLNYCFCHEQYIPQIFYKISSHSFFFFSFSLFLPPYLLSWTRQEHYEWRWQGCILIRKPIKLIGARTRVKRSFRRIHRPYRGWARVRLYSWPVVRHFIARMNACSRRTCAPPFGVRFSMETGIE